MKLIDKKEYAVFNLKKSFDISLLDWFYNLSKEENWYCLVCELKYKDILWINNIKAEERWYNILKLKIKYNPLEFWIFSKITQIFADNKISIYAFTTIDYWYILFDKKYIELVEKFDFKI
jgi:hypothetical protein